jgi:uncharacterized membrane-anchored protein YhcB (DUF1043 family)
VEKLSPCLKGVIKVPFILSELILICLFAVLVTMFLHKYFKNKYKKQNSTVQQLLNKKEETEEQAQELIESNIKLAEQIAHENTLLEKNF